MTVLYLIAMTALIVPTSVALYVGAHAAEDGHQIVGPALILAAALWFLLCWYGLFAPMTEEDDE